MKNFSIKNCVFLLTFCLSMSILHPSSDSDEESPIRAESTPHRFVNTTQLSNNQWKILIEKKRAYFFTSKEMVEITLREGKQPIVRRKAEEYTSPFDLKSKQIDAAAELKDFLIVQAEMKGYISPFDSAGKQIKDAVELIEAVHAVKHKDITGFIEEWGHTKCKCKTRHK